MTSQAIALQDAATLAGMPRKNRWGKKAFTIKTDVKRVKWSNPRTGESGSYSEYGDAALNDRMYRELTEPEAMEIARGIARCGFSASVYIKEYEDGELPYIHLSADTGYITSGQVSIWRVANDTVYREIERVELDEGMRAQAWKRANAR